MITAPVTNEQLHRWKQIWNEKKDSMQPNRISGAQLYAYFQKKYVPMVCESRAFAYAVSQNLAARYGEEAAQAAQIVCCAVDGDIFVAIDLETGYFQVECETIEKCIPIYDDLFLKRGLDSSDLQNYVLTGQYFDMIRNW